MLLRKFERVQTWRELLLSGWVSVHPHLVAKRNSSYLSLRLLPIQSSANM